MNINNLNPCSPLTTSNRWISPDPTAEKVLNSIDWSLIRAIKREKKVNLKARAMEEVLRVRRMEDEAIGIVQDNGMALESLSGMQQNNPRIVMAAVQKNAFAFQFASPYVKNDLEIATVAAQKNGLTLQYMDFAKECVFIVRKAVRQNGLALQYASPNLKEHFWTVVEAIHNDPRAIAYVGPNLLRERPDIAEQAHRLMEERGLLPLNLNE